jgi:uncharacterized protein YecE (DUF72 family)
MAAVAQLVGDIRIGILGWNDAGWRGVFFPPKLAQKRALAYASRAFRSIEINGTHYSLQRPEDFARWDEETPEDFLFAIKGSHHAYEAIAQVRIRSRQFLRARSATPGTEAGSDPVAIPAEFPLRSRN